MIQGGQTPLSQDLKSNPKSPYSSLPKSVQQLFQAAQIDGKSHLLAPQEIASDFPVLLSPTNICCAIMDSKTISYECFTCKKSEHDSEETFIICEKCFIPEDHEGHYFRVVSELATCYCQCGKDLGDNPSNTVFSCNSSHLHQRGKPSVDPGLRNNFMDFFSGLFKVWQFAEDIQSPQAQNFHTKVIKYLQKLCSGSPVYIQLTGELFLRNQNSSEECWLNKFIKKDKLKGDESVTETLLFSLIEEKDFSTRLAASLQDLGDFNEWVSLRLITEIGNINDNLVVMAKNRTFINQLETEYISASLRNENDDILYEYVKESFSNKFSNFMDIFFVLYSKEDKPWYVSQRTANHFLPKIMTIYKKFYEQSKKEEQEEKKKQQEVEEEKEKGQERDKDHSQEQNVRSHSNVAPPNSLNPPKIDESASDMSPQIEGSEIDDFSFSHFVQTVKLIAFFLKWDVKKLMNASDQLEKIGVKPSHFEGYLRLCQTHLAHFPGLEQFLQIMFQITNKNVKEQFLKEMQGLDFEDFFPYALIIMKVIANIDFFFQERQYECLPSEEKHKQKIDNDEKRRKIFEEIIINNETISLGFYLANRKKWRDTDLDTRMFQLAKFDKNTQRLECLENNHKENPLRRLFLHHKGNDYYNKLTPYGSRFQMNDDQILLTKIMITDLELSKIMKKKYLDELAAVEGDEYRRRRFVDSQFAHHYIQWMIWIDTFTQGNDQIAKEELQRLCKDSDHRFSFQFLGKKQIVEKLLNINKPLEDKDEQKEEQGENNNQQMNLEVILDKFNKKKNNLSQKFKQKRESFFNNLASNSLRTLSMESADEQCIICREKEKYDRPLGYLVEVVKKKTLSGIFHSEENKTETMFRSCFHSVHPECYLKSIHQAGKRCPLCSKSVNGLIPLRFNANQKKFNRICFTLISSAMLNAYEILDIQSLFFIIFAHLVETRGLDSLVRPNIYLERRRKKQRLDVFLEDMAQTIYDNASEQQKREYDSSINLLKNDIGLCKNQSLKLLQSVIVEATENKIKNSVVEFDKEKIQKLSQIVEKSDFQIIKNELQDLGAEEINYSTSEAAVNNHDRVKISCQLPKLPPTAADIEKFVDSVCTSCSSKLRSIKCLICLTTYCSQCWRDSNHNNKHNYRLIFKVNEGQMEGRTNTKSINVYLYRNKFNIALKNISYPDYHGDIFKLDREIVEEVEKAFYEEE